MDDDEWFFNSFKRYNELQMFDFPKTAKEIELTSSNNLCVALDRDGSGRNEILVFFLPPALHSKSTQNWNLDRHLSFDHGYFTESNLIQVKCLSNEEKLIISEENGVSLLNINCKESDMLKKLSTITCEIPNARMAVNSINHNLALSGPTSNHRTIINYESMTELLHIEEKDASNLRIPAFCSLDVVSFADVISGQVLLYDVRNAENINTITLPAALQSPKTLDTRWIISTTFDLETIPPDNYNVYLFSTNGNFLVYDSRNLLSPVISAKHAFNCEHRSKSANAMQMRLCPGSKELFSVSGFDENVYICEVKKDSINVVFTHDGHPYNKDEFESDVRTVCSIWLPFISSSTLVSSGSNTSVQCWQFKCP